MASPRRPGIHLEADYVSGRGAVILALLFLAITAAGTYWAYTMADQRTERSARPTAGQAPTRAEETDGARRQVGGVQMTQIGQDPIAAKLQQLQRQSLERTGWIDARRRIARIGIDAAMAAVASRLGEDSVAGRQADRPGSVPEPIDDTLRNDRERASPPDTTASMLQAGVPPLDARARQEVGGPLAEARVVERPGHSVPLDAQLTDQEGRVVRLGRYFDGTLPVLLVPGYYHCTMLCGLLLDGVTRAIGDASRAIGRDYRVVAVSIDPRDTPASARDRRRRVAGSVPAAAWPFLVGSRAAVRRITGAIGFRYAYDPETTQYAHAAVLVALTPDGRVSRYLYGVDFTGDDIDTAVTAAAAGDTGSALKRALLRCFHYTPALRRWAGLVVGMLRGGAAVVIVALATLVLCAARRARRQRREGAAAEAGSP